LLFGLAPQFRPNLVMLPGVLAVFYAAWRPRSRRKLVEMAVYLTAVAIALAPWTIRNYRLTGLVLPTSTHGGVQLWYGTLQTGPYLHSRVYNPRSHFEFSGFDYSSVAGRRLAVSMELAPCAGRDPTAIELVYWTDRRREPVRLAPHQRNGASFVWSVPGQPVPTVLYYFVEAHWSNDEGSSPRVERLPSAGRDGPAIHFISDQHLGDLDVHGDLLDVFDVTRMVRAVVWQEPLGNAARLDFDADGRVTERDIRRAGELLVRSQSGVLADVGPVIGLGASEAGAEMRFADGSTLLVPRASAGLLSDVVPNGEYAGRLVKAALPFSVIDAERPPPPTNPHVCYALRDLAVNSAFYYAEPDAMRRYSALAWDNIRADPAAYLASCAYRAWRLFVVQGTDDPHTAYQFRGSRFLYPAATVVSLTYFILLLAGVVIAVAQKRPLLLLGAPILYVPLTIAWVLTNMRYTVTVQPLVFAFIALAVVAAADRAGTRTAPRP
jgi:hypothetical protein